MMVILKKDIIISKIIIIIRCFSECDSVKNIDIPQQEYINRFSLVQGSPFGRLRYHLRIWMWMSMSILLKEIKPASGNRVKDKVFG